MHEYLRAVGFSEIKDKEQLNLLLQMTEDGYQVTNKYTHCRQKST